MIDLDHISFAEWLVELNVCARDAGYAGASIVKTTGQMCWYSFYEEKLDPDVALEVAAKDGMEFGELYS